MANLPCFVCGREAPDAADRLYESQCPCCGHGVPPEFVPALNRFIHAMLEHQRRYADEVWSHITRRDHL